MSWTPDSELKLKKLWKDGLTGSEIAKVFSTSRSAILGKVHRLKLEARIVSRKPEGKINTEKSVSTEIKTQKLGRKARFKALLLNKNFEPENPTKLENLTDDHCRWPLGEKMEPPSLFCGRKPVDKFPYCQLHLLYGYQSKHEKEEDIITEEDIPRFIQKKIKSA